MDIVQFLRNIPRSCGVAIIMEHIYYCTWRVWLNAQEGRCIYHCLIFPFFLPSQFFFFTGTPKQVFGDMSGCPLMEIVSAVLTLYKI